MLSNNIRTTNQATTAFNLNLISMFRTTGWLIDYMLILLC